MTDNVCLNVYIYFEVVVHLNRCFALNLHTSLFEIPLKYCNSTLPVDAIIADHANPMIAPMINAKTKLVCELQLNNLCQYQSPNITELKKRIVIIF